MYSCEVFTLSVFIMRLRLSGAYVVYEFALWLHWSLATLFSEYDRVQTFLIVALSLVSCFKLNYTNCIIKNSSYSDFILSVYLFLFAC